MGDIPKKYDLLTAPAEMMFHSVPCDINCACFDYAKECLGFFAFALRGREYVYVCLCACVRVCACASARVCVCARVLAYVRV